jgi:hypothetical protein
VDNIVTTVAQGVREHHGLRALTRPIDAFERNEDAGHG